MITETVYKSRDNTNDLLLVIDGVAQDLNNVTKAAIVSSDVNYNSTDNADYFDLTEMPQGVLKIKLGNSDIAVGQHKVDIVTYDSGNINGIKWGSIILVVI